MRASATRRCVASCASHYGPASCDSPRARSFSIRIKRSRRGCDSCSRASLSWERHTRSSVICGSIICHYRHARSADRHRTRSSGTWLAAAWSPRSCTTPHMPGRTCMARARGIRRVQKLADQALASSACRWTGGSCCCTIATLRTSAGTSSGESGAAPRQSDLVQTWSSQRRTPRRGNASGHRHLRRLRCTYAAPVLRQQW